MTKTVEPTARETEILQSLADGRTTKQTATWLGISTTTVQTHLRKVYAKLGAQTQLQAVLAALRLGIVTLSPERETS